jgi:cellulose synthase (UDP-forming)
MSRICGLINTMQVVQWEVTSHLLLFIFPADEGIHSFISKGKRPMLKSPSSVTSSRWKTNSMSRREIFFWLSCFQNPNALCADQPHKSKPSQKFWGEIRLTYLTLSVTAFATAFFSLEALQSFWTFQEQHQWREVGEIVLFLAIIYFLLYGNFVYQFTRIGYYRRRLAHRPATAEEMRTLMAGVSSAPSVAILIPAYKEEPAVVFQTVLSAALQDYSNKRVVLLIDDPPTPQNQTDQCNLETLRALPIQIQEFLKPPATKAEAAWHAFRKRASLNRLNLSQERLALATLYKEIEEWFQTPADQFPVKTHMDSFFVKKILRKHQKNYSHKTRSIQETFQNNSRLFTEEHIGQEYQALVRQFTPAICCFERKRYCNLSHRPNKAMNLNSYLGLMGKKWSEVNRQAGLYLEPASPELEGIFIPDAKYILTLDADSLLLSEYTSRLVYLLEQPGAERLAVAQTPYSAIPQADSLLERIAGATTDIQYITHQGFSTYHATYWVGANALLRKEALEDIVTTDQEGQVLSKIYIQDRTVIEDTESTIDLIEKGWHLHNYPARLAYSATPPDFGALLIQRRRWANGGLIIFPKLLRYLFKGDGEGKHLSQGLIRCHYLTSITAVNVGLLLLLFYPFGAILNSLWLPLTALPYYVLYGRDLVHCGYTWKDLPKVYALNLLLIPVNLGGVLKSLQQWWTGQKVPFCRTPKVPGRTATPVLYLGWVYALFLGMVVGAGLDLAYDQWFHLLFMTINGGFLAYAITRFIGLKESLEDMRVQWSPPLLASNFRRKSIRAPQPLPIGD